MVYREAICDICKKRFDSRDAKYIDNVFESSEGYLTDAEICPECLKKYQHILDEGTEAMAEFIMGTKR